MVDIIAVDESAKVRAHREAVLAFEDELRKQPHLPIPVEHDFAHGVYARTVILPKGATCTGRIHKYSQINIISKGEITVSTPDGPLHVTAPARFVSPPGTKRAVHAIEETIWTTIIGTFETDLDKIVSELTVETEEEYQRAEYGKVLEIE